MKTKILQAISQDPNLANYFGMQEYNNDFGIMFGECNANGKIPEVGQVYVWFWLGAKDAAPAGIADFVLAPESGKIFGYII